MKKTIIILVALLSLSGCKVVNRILGDGPPYRNQYKFPLPDAKITEKQLCGKKDCVPGTLGISFSFTKKTHSVNINENTSEKDIAAQVLGHVIKEGNFYGKFAPSCSSGDNNPFKTSDISRLSSTGREIDYVRKEKLNININAAVDANVNELKQLTNDNGIITEIEAKIKAEYSKLSGKTLSIKGTYSEWGVSKEALNRLVKGTDYIECRQYMKANNRRVITAVGIVFYDISFQAESLDKIASEVQAFVEQKGINGNISFTFKKEVSQTLKAVTDDFYQILTWRHVGINEFDNM